MDKFDVNSDGKISFDEFWDLAQKIYPYCVNQPK